VRNGAYYNIINVPSCDEVDGTGGGISSAVSEWTYPRGNNDGMWTLTSIANITSPIANGAYEIETASRLSRPHGLVAGVRRYEAALSDCSWIAAAPSGPHEPEPDHCLGRNRRDIPDVDPFAEQLARRQDHAAGGIAVVRDPRQVRDSVRLVARLLGSELVDGRCTPLEQPDPPLRDVGEPEPRRDACLFRDAHGGAEEPFVHPRRDRASYLHLLIDGEAEPIDGLVVAN